MDKTILKKFAIESRQDLMQKIESKIKLFYVDETFSKQQNGDVYVLSNEKHTLSLSKEEYEKRELLVKRINELGLEQVIEEAAYTWFNRIVAIRYMEINDYLPLTKDNQSLGIRVLSSKDNTPDPEIMKFTNLTNPELDIDFKKEKYIELKDDNEKYKYVLLLVCKKLGRVIPQVFDGITDYIDLLIPENLLNETGFVNKIITDVAESNYNQVEIIGWLYQYYISEKKEQVFENAKKGVKIKNTDIPSATQLFTPEWIVKYMVENSIGRLIGNYDNLEYYVKSDNDKMFITKKKISEIQFIDPCCGSGHILLKAFSLFYNGYLKLGYTKPEAISNTIKNNIFGIDIDERAIQLTILSICLKACEFDKSFFSKNLVKELKIVNIINSKNLNADIINYNISEKNHSIVKYLVDRFKEAEQYGSLLKVDNYDFESLKEELDKSDNFLFKKELTDLLNLSIILNKKYDIVCTNPPYMGRKSMNEKLSDFLQKEYPKTKLEMYSAFIERCLDMTCEDGFLAMVTIHTWMFITSFEETRNILLNNGTFINMLHTGASTFPELSSFNVLATAFCYNKKILNEYQGTYIRLADYYNINEKIENFSNESNYYYVEQEKFDLIPGKAILYWISNDIRNAFTENKKFGEYYLTRVGLQTSDNKRFVRQWYEVDYKKIGFNLKSREEALSSQKKWYPYNKGGDYRKWYGNNEAVVNWENDGKEIREYNNYLNSTRTSKIGIANQEYYFKKGITWSIFGFENFGVRYKDDGFIFDTSGASTFPNDKYIYYVTGYLCSNVAFKFLSLLAPTVNFQPGNIASLPYKEVTDTKEIDSLVKSNIDICRKEWDMYETSWNFEKHPLISITGNCLKEKADKFKNLYNDLREELRKNEIELNQLYSKIYLVENDIDCSVSDRDLSIKDYDEKAFIVSLISYAVGCMFGRYSLDKDGLVFAGGEFDENNYKTFKADADNIIPITDEAYFADDIVGRFKDFIEVVYGKETLNVNLDFIAETLGKKGTETSEETIRRYFLNDFYSDHIKMYQKKPIYWLFDSGKKNGFKALIYMHRYNENTVPKVRLDYLHRVQNTYDKLLTDVNYRLTTELSVSDKKIAQNRQADLNAKLQEITAYDEKIAHIANQRISIDLDDGVTANYSKFADILAKIK